MKSGNLDPQDMKQLYGGDALESDYAFHKKMLELTPSAITPFISRRQAISGQMLLVIKAISMPKRYSRFDHPFLISPLTGDVFGRRLIPQSTKAGLPPLARFGRWLPEVRPAG